MIERFKDEYADKALEESAHPSARNPNEAFESQMLMNWNYADQRTRRAMKLERALCKLAAIE